MNYLLPIIRRKRRPLLPVDEVEGPRPVAAAPVASEIPVPLVVPVEPVAVVEVPEVLPVEALAGPSTKTPKKQKLVAPTQ